MTSRNLLRAVTARLRDHGLRFTPGRRAVVEALERVGGPRSAGELSEIVEVPLSSLYRCLSTLEVAGVVEPHNAVRGVTRYELSEWLRGHHHHLICIDCGAVEDVALPESSEDEVRRLVTDIGKRSAFATTGHSLEIEGRCARCA
jgi:Fe2+ or Zn2+ uptake regulation protein